MTPSQTEALIQDVERNLAPRPARTARSALLSLVCALLVLPVMMLAAALGGVMSRASSPSGPSLTGTSEYSLEHAGRNEELMELSRAAEREKRAELEKAWFLTLGLGVGLPLLLEITAIVSGILALSWIGRSAGALAGRGLAIAGLVVAGLNLAALGLLLAVAL